MALLRLDDVHVYYDHVHALKGVTLEVHQGEIVTLLGANGAGKSTTLRAISGLVRPRQGSITFDGRDLTRIPAHLLPELGIAHCPEGRQVFAPLTVDENLTLGAYRRKDPRAVEESRRYVFDLFPRLKERRHQLAGTMSGGEQQMLAIGRALMSNPKVLLLDEPSLGLAPLLVRQIFAQIKEINRQGVTVLLVEQNARAALRLADRAYVLETGRVTLQGPAADLLADPRMQEAYLGGRAG
ncbi:MAG: ABC transporter ATP-binding protein [Thermaerobacter sp.]|nr:ABC transporter ATP-binding protein [Bacillota bacterium]REJ34751.1 MAG: ABC transporter ATP-binding protein [Bacillota bacterium]